MKQKQIDKLKEILAEEEKQYDFNDYAINYMDEDELKELELEELEDYMHDLTHDMCFTDVIYYSNAISYLQEHDPSLHESLELASDLGYNVSDLNSEILASLLKSQNLREYYYDFVQEVLNRMEAEEQ